MGDRKYLTAEEVAERYRALRNWRAMRVGPAFQNRESNPLPVDGLDAWEKKNIVSCRASGRLPMTESDQA
jgi:hypothetical protein